MSNSDIFMREKNFYVQSSLFIKMNTRIMIYSFPCAFCVPDFLIHHSLFFSIFPKNRSSTIMAIIQSNISAKVCEYASP